MADKVPGSGSELVIYGANINRCNDKYATILALDAVRVAKKSLRCARKSCYH